MTISLSIHPTTTHPAHHNPAAPNGSKSSNPSLDLLSLFPSLSSLRLLILAIYSSGLTSFSLTFPFFPPTTPISPSNLLISSFALDSLLSLPPPPTSSQSILLLPDSESCEFATQPPTLEIISLRRSNESFTAADTRAEIVDVDSLSADRVVVVGRSSRWTAVLDWEGEVSGETVGVRRSLFSFLDAAERLAPQAPGENFVGWSSVAWSSGC